MGRARRNQRDAIRKKRAKKRNKGKQEEEDDDLVVRCSSRQPQTASISHDEVTKTRMQEVAPTTEEKVEGSMKGSQVATKEQGVDKAPLTKIERMRLKKQQQKARRKEKKIARETATGAS